jgi:hypothetical protein
MFRQSLLALLTLAALGLTACQREAAAPTTAPAAPAPTAEAAPATPAAVDNPTDPVPPTTAAVGASGDPIGVPECDDFLNKYQACIADKVPAESRAALEMGMTQWRDSWRQLAANPQTKDALVQACNMSREQSKGALAAYGCTDL